MKANWFVLAAAALFACTGAFGQNETQRFFEKLSPQETAMGDCYRLNSIRFAVQTCEPASTVVDAAYGSCRREEKAYADTMIKLGGPSFADAPEHMISMAKKEMRQTSLSIVLDARIESGRCTENSN
jgi:hypothetical protein